MATEDDSDVPETGAIFTFGKSKFGDNNLQCKFWLKNDQVSRVCCGDEHTALVTEKGRIFMFGSNEWGQLGLGHTKTVTKPTRIKDKSIKEEKVKLVGCGRHHTILATESGKLFGFGDNAEGQLGLGADDSQMVTRPQYIESLRVRNFKILSCGLEHSAALTEDGKLYLWGGGNEGQLGLGETRDSAEPTLLPFDEAIVHVACGYYHTAFVTESGKLYTFGETEYGKLGQGEDPPSHRLPRVVHDITGQVVSVACGGSHTVAITASGSVYTFGDGSNGQLGHGTTILLADTPQELSWGKNLKVKLASCGENTTSLITDKGQLYTFGDGRHGKLALGDENFANQFTPSFVPRFENFIVQKVSCGGCHMLAIAKVRTENGVKENWEDSEEEEDADTGPLNNLESSLRKSADQSGGSLDLSGSIAARNRRREKLPDPMGTMNRTLPPLNSSLRGLPPLGQTQPLVDDTLSKKTLPQIHKVEEPESKSAQRAEREDKHKRERKKEDTEEEESSEVSVTEESSEEEEEKRKPGLVRKTASEPTERVPQPKPRAMPRKSKEEDESPVESEEDEEESEESEESEEEEGKMYRKKHLKREEERKEEVNKAKVKPKPASRRMTKEQEKKSEDSEDASEETEEEEEEDSEEDVGKKKLSKKKAAEEEEKKKAEKKEKGKKKKKSKPISVFGRRKTTQDEDDESSDEDEDEEDEEEVEKQKKSKGAKDKNDKKKKKKDKNKKSDENSEDEEEEEEDEDDEKDSKKTKSKDKKDKKGKKKTKENDSEDKEEDEASDEEEEGDEKDEKKADGKKEVEEKQSKTCTIL